jgi:hypothetical protein
MNNMETLNRLLKTGNSIEEIVEAIEMVKEIGSDFCEKKITEMLSELSETYPEYSFVFWQIHGIECIDVIPSLYDGAPRSFDIVDAEMAVRNAGSNQDMRQVEILISMIEILKVGGMCLENFQRELGEIRVD